MNAQLQRLATPSQPFTDMFISVSSAVLYISNARKTGDLSPGWMAGCGLRWPPLHHDQVKEETKKQGGRGAPPATNERIATIACTYNRSWQGGGEPHGPVTQTARDRAGGVREKQPVEGSSKPVCVHVQRRSPSSPPFLQEPEVTAAGRSASSWDVGLKRRS